MAYLITVDAAKKLYQKKLNQCYPLSKPNIEDVENAAENEIFYSIQGEGARAGTANVFVRFTGCNMQCDTDPGPLSPGGFKCDTEFASGRKMTAEEIGKEIITLFDDAGVVRGKNSLWVIFTGGEPLLQVDIKLINSLLSVGIVAAIETNGTLPVPKDWFGYVVVSPKCAEHAVEYHKKGSIIDELRYVRGYGQGIPKPAHKAHHKIISPAFDGGRMDRKALDWCMELVKANPEWRLSVQMHNIWAVR